MKREEDLNAAFFPLHFLIWNGFEFVIMIIFSKFSSTNFGFIVESPWSKELFILSVRESIRLIIPMFISPISSFIRPNKSLYCLSLWLLLNLILLKEITFSWGDKGMQLELKEEVSVFVAFVLKFVELEENWKVRVFLRWDGFISF